MVHSNNKRTPAGIRGTVYICTSILALVIINCAAYMIVRSHVLNGNIKFDTSNYISIIALEVSAITLTISIVKDKLNATLTSEKSIEIVALNCKQNNVATIRCTIKNNGKKRLYPKSVILMLEKGKESKSGEMLFSDGLFQHVERKTGHKYDDCLIGKQCKYSCFNEEPLCINTLPVKFRKNIIALTSYSLLSSKTIQYLDPSESCSQDITFRLPKGVYRASVIWIDESDKDCICHSVNFDID